MRRRVAGLLASACLLASGILMAGCGGGSSSGGGGNNPPPQPLVILTLAQLPSAVVGQPYSMTLQASGGTPPYSWTMTGAVPGMSLSTSGVLSGTATESNNYNFTITVKDSKQKSASLSAYFQTVSSIAFQTTSQLGDANIAIPAAYFLQVTGGAPPYSFSMAAGSALPPGLSISSSGYGGAQIQGTPTATGKYTFTVKATDTSSPPSQASQQFSINVLNGLVLPNATLPDAVVNLAYQEQIQPAGGTPPYHFQLTPGSSMPAGLLLDTTTGIVTGTPTTQADYNYNFGVQITDSAASPATINPLVSVLVRGALAFQTVSLKDGVRTQGYWGELDITGGRPPYTIGVASGSLPPGVTIASTPYPPEFNMNGTATTDGTYNFTLKVTDSYRTPNSATQNFQIRIADPLSVTGPNPITLLYNQSYTTTFPATGGIPPYTWSMEYQIPGFTLDPSTGTFTGQYTGTDGFNTPNSVYVTDSSNPPQTASSYFAFEMIGKVMIETNALPAIVQSSHVKISLVTMGGGPFQWTISSGALPPGITLTNVQDAGCLSGSPTTAGTYNFTVNVSDSNVGNLHQSYSKAYSWVVKPASQMPRNDSMSTATPVSSIRLLASVSPYADSGVAGPDVDYYVASAAPGTVVNLGVSNNDDFKQPPYPNSMLPVIEVLDTSGARMQTCASWGSQSGPFNLPCINSLPSGAPFVANNYFYLQVPGTGTSPVTFYVRVMDERGDARPDFIYTFYLQGVN